MVRVEREDLALGSGRLVEPALLMRGQARRQAKGDTIVHDR
jgi:hypothetical protein